MSEEAEKLEAVEAELSRIVSSPLFRRSPRGREFLVYVVRQKLQGASERLKERTIGVEVFGRPTGYSTGEDPVVRVQASDVRRKLQQFYIADTSSSAVRIELPSGSYVPCFRFSEQVLEDPTMCGHSDDGAQASSAPATIPQGIPAAQISLAGPDDPAVPSAVRPGYLQLRTKLQFGLFLGVSCVLAFFAGSRLHEPHAEFPAQTELQQFWSPIFSTVQPVLICLAKPVAYRPSNDLYRRYAATHPGTFATEVQRSTDPLPLKGDTVLQWKDMALYRDFGVAAGDVHAAVQLSRMLTIAGKPAQLRIGEAYSFSDLRNSPAIFVGAFNNRWTVDLASDLRFSFTEEGGRPSIRENLPGGRVWTTHVSMDGSTLTGTDYALVAKLLHTPTGQFAMIVGGLTGSGTEAASEFLTDASSFQDSVAGAPPDWTQKNAVFLLQTEVTDNVAGPPKVVASYFW